MKRATIVAAVFIVVYIGLCYLVPGWRIKLDAPPLDYFVASLQSMMLLKGSMVAAVAVAASLLMSRKECGR